MEGEPQESFEPLADEGDGAEVQELTFEERAQQQFDDLKAQLASLGSNLSGVQKVANRAETSAFSKL